ncbi:MAG: hypothetical protein AB1758_38280 [Candidatus Eremiobacterota bacterium]
MIVATGTIQDGSGTFTKRNGEQIQAQGNGVHWTGTNQQTGTTYDFTREPQNSTWTGTRTDADGTEHMGQFTVFYQKDANGQTTATVYDFNRFDDGWKNLR